jgi:hypothetical protein
MHTMCSDFRITGSYFLCTILNSRLNIVFTHCYTILNLPSDIVFTHFCIEPRQPDCEIMYPGDIKRQGEEEPVELDMNKTMDEHLADWRHHLMALKTNAAATERIINAFCTMVHLFGPLGAEFFAQTPKGKCNIIIRFYDITIVFLRIYDFTIVIPLLCTDYSGVYKGMTERLKEFDTYDMCVNHCKVWGTDENDEERCPDCRELRWYKTKRKKNNPRKSLYTVNYRELLKFLFGDVKMSELLRYGDNPLDPLGDNHLADLYDGTLWTPNRDPGEIRGVGCMDEISLKTYKGGTTNHFLCMYTSYGDNTVNYCDYTMNISSLRQRHVYVAGGL